ncbi:MAG: S26 family signal peptidase [Proteobacteria bacterium]|nr:S26 family signal peptidase [Pseudomonadota bacterium]
MAAVFVSALAIGLWLPGHISVTLTSSVGYRLFFLTEPESRDFRQGDYLLFDKHLDQAQTDRLLKKVGCAPGQRLSAVEGKFSCDGHFLGRALAQDSKGNRLPQFIFSGFVPPGSLFMVGSHPRSYDSRYFGFIHADCVLKKAYPLW